MKLDLPPIPEAERTPLVAALLAILDAQQLRLEQLEDTVQLLRDEIATLKGQKPRPVLAPSRLETPTPKSIPDADHKRPGSQKCSKNAALIEADEVPLLVADPPAGSVAKGYEEYVVQELLLGAQATRYLRQRLQLPDGRTFLAPLPDDVLPGQHFGPRLIAFIRHQYHQCNVTQPLLREQLHDWGLVISAGQIHRLLTEDVAAFHQEKAEVLAAGLEVSSYIGVDDTGARHQGHNGFCTAIGNEWFAYFESTDSKSRLNFLQVLRGAATGYAINEATLAYWDRYELSRDVVERLCLGPRQFADEAAWQARLAELDLTTKFHVRLATEGALLGQVLERGVSPNLVVLSDGAGQFDLLVHASCWVHAERPLARQVPYSEGHREVIERVRQQIWELYQDLKAYQAEPDCARKAELEARFEAVVGQKTGYPTSVDRVLVEMGEHKADLLRVLERPEVPLHNNGTESIIRGYVKTRKVSGGTRSDEGRRCRDTFASLKKTCRKLGLSFWAYLRDRMGGGQKLPRLADLIRERAAPGGSEALAGAVPG